MSAPPINESVRVYAELRDRLLAADADLDEETLTDTLEGETDLRERIVGLCRAALLREAQASSLDELIKDYQARKKRWNDGAKRLREIALWAMQEVGLSNIVAAEASISVRAGRPSVVIGNPDELPMWALKYEPTPNKDAIKEALEAGQECPGATLSNGGPSLTIRTR